MKKLIISSDVLKPALKKIGQVVNEKTLNPITKNVYCIIGKNEVELITTDMETFISCKCIAETGGQEGFELLIPFDFLNRVVGEYKSSPITIEHPSSRKARIVCDTDVYELNSLEKLEDFPKVPASHKKPMHTLSGEFVELLTRALLTCGKDNLRPAMTRVCLDMKPDLVNMVSTDAHVMYRHRLVMDVSEEAQLQFSAKTIVAMEGMENVELSWTTKKICIKGGDVTIWTQRHEDKYPNYNAVIPNYESNLEVERADLLSALHKTLISSISTNQTNLLPKRESKVLVFEADDPDLSRKINVKIPGEFTGTVENIAFSSKKLITILHQVGEARIRLHIHSPTKAILISTEKNPDYLGLLMPLIVNPLTK